MATIQATDINNLNATVYSLGTKSKFDTNLPSNLQTETGNNVEKETKITNVNIVELRKAITILEQKFSNNCCQSQCHTYSTISSCQVEVCQGCEKCQSCELCQYTSQCKNCNIDCYSVTTNCNYNCLL